MLSTKNKLLLCLVLDNVGFTMMIVLFFPYINGIGGSQLYQGSIMSVMSFIGLIWNPMIGSLGDSYGRKIILRRMTMISAISNAMLLVSDSLAWIFVARVMSAFGGPLIPVLATAASEFLSKEEQSSYFGKLPAVMAIAFIGGSLVGGFISELPNGFTLCFLLMVVSNVTNIGVVSTLPDTTRPQKKEEESLSILKIADREVKNIVVKLKNVKWAEYSDIFSVKLSFELGCSLFIRSIGPTFVEYGVQRRSMGYVFTLLSVCTIVANIVVESLKKTVYAGDSLGGKRLFHAAALYVTTALMMSFSDSLYFFTAGLIPMAVANTISGSTFTEALMAKASDADRGGVNGAFESITSLCGLATPLAAGFLSDWYGNKFVLQMALLPSSLGLWLTYKRL
ncbi:major facilitator superfamily domain-containing protein 9-like [Coccinella septempunctata]|uniref:major facilitator superfamily domain-containing protein 9-like n=1 Tax=Coccinella septempunctata TaxID=41139 RepID=UPI001D08DFE7|nr:major facilitator superfamily domain-containing protein 9-like [Coccinella septempunctata]